MTRRAMVFLTAALTGLGGGAAAASEPGASPGCAIGVFDSRAVALAYWRSDEGQRRVNQLVREAEAAKAAGRGERAEQLAQGARRLQDRMHRQVFSRGSVAEILETVRDQLPAVARQAGVQAIVSKWHAPYVASSVRQVDVTMMLVELFRPDEAVRRTARELLSKPPAPADALPLP